MSRKHLAQSRFSISPVQPRLFLTVSSGSNSEGPAKTAFFRVVLRESFSVLMQACMMLYCNKTAPHVTVAIIGIIGPSRSERSRSAWDPWMQGPDSCSPSFVQMLTSQPCVFFSEVCCSGRPHSAFGLPFIMALPGHWAPEATRNTCAPGATWTLGCTLARLGRELRRP